MSKKSKSPALSQALNQIVTIDGVAPTVTTANPLGTILVDGPVTYHPNFKMSRGPAPTSQPHPQPHSTNTRSRFSF
jgi:hypothetical protein